MESKIRKLQKLERRDRAMWYLFVKCNWELSEIGDLFKIAKQTVWEKLNKVNDEVVAGALKFKDLESLKEE